MHFYSSCNWILTENLGRFLVVSYGQGPVYVSRYGYLRIIYQLTVTSGLFIPVMLPFCTVGMYRRSGRHNYTDNKKNGNELVCLYTDSMFIGYFNGWASKTVVIIMAFYVCVINKAEKWSIGEKKLVFFVCECFPGLIETIVHKR